jgi:hypothetical protein
MLGWLVDNFALVTFVLAALAVGCFAYAWSTGRGRYLAIGLVPVALIALVWLLGRFVVSDQQKILNSLEAMRHGVEVGDFEEVFQHISDQFRADGRTGDIRIWDQQVERKNENAADCFFNFRADHDGAMVAMNSAKGEFVKEAGTWKLKGFEVYRFGTREKVNILGN